MGGLQSYLVLKAGVRSRVDALAYQPDDVHETDAASALSVLAPKLARSRRTYSPCSIV